MSRAQVRICGKFEDVEAITRDLRRVLAVTEETDEPAELKGHITRFLVVQVQSEHVFERNLN